MNHIATKLRFLNDVMIELTFLDGKIIQFDLTKLINKYPQFNKLKEDRKLFESGELFPLGETIYWNDEIDFDVEIAYADGQVVDYVEPSLNQKIAHLLTKAREERDLTQTQLAKLSSIDQGDISRIERGIGNPTLKKIEKLFNALDKKIDIKI
jgi:DNA-binding XRE family transcriptional regulator